jgi:hypothetical protein
LVIEPRLSRTYLAHPWVLHTYNLTTDPFVLHLNAVTSDRAYKSYRYLLVLVLIALGLH